jgi:hypothetical protein
MQVGGEFPRSTVFTGQLTFRLEKFYHRLLHNETAFAIQRRLQWDGHGDHADPGEDVKTYF